MWKNKYVLFCYWDFYKFSYNVDNNNMFIKKAEVAIGNLFI